MTSMALRLGRAALQRPRVTVAAAALVVALAVPGLLRLEIATDGRSLLPRQAPEALYDAALRRDLALRDPLAVVLWASHPDGIFNPVTLGAVTELTARLAAIPGVEPEHLTSLATEPGLRLRPGTLDPLPLLDPLPSTAPELARLRDDLDEIGLYDGVLRSADGRGTAIVVGVPDPGADEPGRRARLVRAVRARLAGGAPPGHTLELVGAPAAEALLGDHLLADLGRLVPLALVVMALVFLVAFRRLATALLPLAEAGGCLLVVFGAMGWLGIPVALNFAVLPVVLVAVGVADEVHVFHRFARLSRERPGRPVRDIVDATLEQMAPPVTRTSLTTAVAFLSFALSPIPPVRHFGVLAAAGVLACWLFTLTVLPALLVLVPRNRLLAPPRTAAAGRRQAFTAFAHLVTRRPWLAPAAAALLLAAVLPGVLRLRVEDSWLAGFDSASPLVRATDRFEEQFLGAHLLRVTVEGEPLERTGTVPESALDHDRLVLPAAADLPLERLAGARLWVTGAGGAEWRTWVESAVADGEATVLRLPPRGGSPRFSLAPRPGETIAWRLAAEPLLQPSVLARIAALEGFLADQPGVGGVHGPARHLAAVGRMIPITGEAALPDDPSRIAARWRNLATARGEGGLREVVDPEGYRRGLINVYLRGSTYAGSERLVAALADHERRHLAPAGLRLRLAGDVALSRALIAAVVSTQTTSLLLSLGLIFAVVALAGRTWRWGAVALLPPGAAVLLAFSAMGWLGVPLGVATSMFAGMVLGVGVDQAIHLLSRLRQVRRGGAAGAEAVATAVADVGPAVLTDALAVGLGFGVLTLSAVPANERLGALLVLAVGTCLAITLLVLPGLLVLVSRSRAAQPAPLAERGPASSPAG
ncbi:MAG TPA: MMPL family transporter [Thermoanaerobaculia bacterium]|nr:MMPL family transporter [Thermoanaerobaculia bacterium]